MEIISRKEMDSEFSGIFGGLERAIAGMFGDDQPDRAERNRRRQTQKAAVGNGRHIPMHRSPPQDPAFCSAEPSAAPQNGHHFPKKTDNPGPRAYGAVPVVLGSKPQLQKEKVTSNQLDPSKQLQVTHGAKRAEILPTTSEHSSETTIPPNQSGLERNAQHNSQEEKYQWIPDRRAGIGLLIEACPDKGKVFVKEILKAGPAFSEGRIQVNDELVEVEGHKVANMAVQSITDLILGPVDSVVTLTLKNSEDYSQYVVSLQRACNPAPFLVRNESFETVTTKGTNITNSGSNICATNIRKGPETCRGTAGVGLAIKMDSNHKTIVKDIAVGGPADICGKIKVMDQIIEVNGQKTAGLDIVSIRNLILGPEKSSVCLVLADTEQSYSVLLIRKNVGKMGSKLSGTAHNCENACPSIEKIPTPDKQISDFSSCSCAQGVTPQSNVHAKNIQTVANTNPSGLAFAGVGLAIDANPAKGLPRVLGIVPGGAAASNGMIQRNDQLLLVDGHDATTLNAKEITNLVLGPDGSSVVLKLQRPSELNMVYTVKLIRHPPKALQLKEHSVAVPEPNGIREPAVQPIERMSADERWQVYNLQRRRPQSFLGTNPAASAPTSTVRDFSNYDFSANRFQRAEARSPAPEV